MKKITLSFNVLAAIIAVTILQACARTPATQVAKPTLDPSSGCGNQGDKITVRITTATLDANLRWTDDNGSTWHQIQGPSGDAITVFGRTLTAIGYKNGMGDSPASSGDYRVPPPPCP